MLKILEELAKNKSLGLLQDRIFSQLRFAKIISSENQGKYNQLVQKAEQYLLDYYEKEGTFTLSIVLEIEEMLSEIAKEAKDYKVLCVAHAHIDMNWMWAWDETVAITLDTFRTMLDIMTQYPDYKFSQSQASVYKIVEEYDPDMLLEIKKRVQEKRWEVTASTWVETDKNMPNGESMVRHILYTKKYLSKLFDIDPDSLNIDFEPDTFGHNANIPEIMSQGGVKYYYHCRGYAGSESLYRWVSPSGASVIAYKEPNWYNGSVSSEFGLQVPELATKTGSKTVLKVFGVGDHGGGPTRRDIEQIRTYQSWPIFPCFEFGTYHQYFEAIETLRDSLPVVKSELNFIFDGCYSSQSKIKEGNRISEALLKDSEAIMSFSSLLTGIEYPSKTYQDAWEKVLFNQFHDIITGSGVAATREYACAHYQDVCAAATAKKKIAMKKITDKVDTSKLCMAENINTSIAEGGGAGYSQCGRMSGKNRIYHIFNPSSFTREETAEVVVWDYEGDQTKVGFQDALGDNTITQFLEKGDYWGHTFSKYSVWVKVPAMGYATYLLNESATSCEYSVITHDCDQKAQVVDKFILENQWIKAEISTVDGSIRSLSDKENQIELIDQARIAGNFRLMMEAEWKSITEWNGGMSAWVVGRYKNTENLNRNIEMKWVARGALLSKIKCQTSFGNSKLTYYISLRKDSRNLEYEVECDWQEVGDESKGTPNLNFYLPLSYKTSKYRFDNSFGTIDRDEENMDRPGNSFVAGIPSNGPRQLMLMTKTKYGFRCQQNDMAVTLIRSSFSPDPYPETGMHIIPFAIAVMDADCKNQELIERSNDYNHPLSVVSGATHSGDLPLELENLSVVEGNVVISSVKMAEEGKALLIRLYETEGRESSVVLRLCKPLQCAYFTDINERKSNQSEKPDVEGQTISFKALPNAIVNIMVEF